MSRKRMFLWILHVALLLLLLLLEVQPVFSFTSTGSFRRYHFPSTAWSSNFKASSSKYHTSTCTAEPFCLHPIDYSAANEFIQEHYRHIFENGDFYFENGAYCAKFDEDNHDSQDKPIEPIYNARNGILLLNKGNDLLLQEPAQLERDGFQLIQQQSPPTQVTDWTNLQQIKQYYLKELRYQILPQILGNDIMNDEISHAVFWNPVLRGENQTVGNAERDMTSSTPPTSPTAGMVHIDTDVGAYDTQQLIRLIKKNQISAENDGSPVEVDFDEIINAIDNGQRFAILNFWRNADADNPIQRQPLAVFSPHYDGNNNNNKASAPFYFPRSKPDPKSSRWYTFPEMTSNEILVFKQYDRDGLFPSDVWHCALKSIANKNAPPRISFDIRAFLVYKTKVDGSNNHRHHRDRYGNSRIRPILSHEESGAFCNQQAQKRGLHTS